MKWKLEERHARLLWAAHSAWALVSGIAVLVLAHNRYGFLRWVVLFIALTWISTLFFARFGEGEHSKGFRLAQHVVSYLTRVMYQETLFFLLPFYFYSATVRSWNFLYVLALAGFAVLSCFDVLFDRLLREHRWFASGFFAFVSFSALQFFLPLLLRARITRSVYLAAAISFVAAVLVSQPFRELVKPRRLGVVALVFAAVLGFAWVLQPLSPPVPLRLTSLRLSGTIDRRTLSAPKTYEREIPASALARGRIYAVATVFSPQRIPANVQMRFVQDGKVLRESRDVEVNARPGGFRVWDSLLLPSSPASDRYRIEIWIGKQLLGQREVRVVR